MRILYACVAGFILDAIFGDPVWLYHPVRIIGKWITVLEKSLRSLFREEKRQLLIAGVILWFGVVLVSVGIPEILLRAVERVAPALAFCLETFWCYQILAARSLKVESGKVYDALMADDLPEARKAVSMIVGRDTQNLTAEGVTKAAVETVAENTSDGVIAPLLFLLLGGAPLGFFYKAVNTMDSMVGYKNDRYLYFGRYAARMDDVLNYIPSRISAVFMIASAYLLGLWCRIIGGADGETGRGGGAPRGFAGYDGRQAWRIFRRDRMRHASPNSAQTEAVCAGALRIQLAGDAWYFGKLCHKETLGDDTRRIEPEDIRRAGRLMDGAAILTLLVFGGIRLLFCQL
ncbi:adenosylcobinamide-phosphate synthase CbiB [Roseburia hominis]